MEHVWIIHVRLWLCCSGQLLSMSHLFRAGRSSALMACCASGQDSFGARTMKPCSPSSACGLQFIKCQASINNRKPPQATFPGPTQNLHANHSQHVLLPALLVLHVQPSPAAKVPGPILQQSAAAAAAQHCPPGSSTYHCCSLAGLSPACHCCCSTATQQRRHCCTGAKPPAAAAAGRSRQQQVPPGTRHTGCRSQRSRKPCCRCCCCCWWWWGSF